MLFFKELTGFQARSLIDLQQIYEAWHAADEEMRNRFAGHMRWREKGGRDYLFRKIGNREIGLGVKSPATELAYQSFTSGREIARERLSGLVMAMDTQAAVARSVGLGRVPVLVARLLRLLEKTKILGHLRIVGTNAMFAYEALAGIRVSGEVLATGDIDLLLDARRRLRLTAGKSETPTVIGLLRQLDHSFATIPGKPYRVANKDGFMVDLIRPETRPPWKREPGAEPLTPEDLAASPIQGLQWLVHAPPVETVVIDERGYPAPIVVPDPRIWLLHKLWLSNRHMRQEEKKRRDLLQAEMTWRMVTEHLPQYPLDDGFAATLPKALRIQFETLRPQAPTLSQRDVDDLDAGSQPDEPGW